MNIELIQEALLNDFRCVELEEGCGENSMTILMALKETGYDKPWLDKRIKRTKGFIEYERISKVSHDLSD